MVTSLKVSIVGDRQLVHGLKLWQTRISDWRPFWDDIEQFLQDRIKLSFATEGGSSEGGRWEPLSPKYAEWKQQHYPGRGMLVLSGGLKGSLTEDLHPQALRQKRKTTFNFSSRNPLAVIHHEGLGDWLPARPLLVLTETDKKAIVEHARMWVTQRALESGLGVETAFMRRGRLVTQLRGPGGRFI